jgi:hypothetical protein
VLLTFTGWLCRNTLEGYKKTPFDLRTGIVQAKKFGPDCKSDDWCKWDISFNYPEPFYEDPVVLFTASNLGVTQDHNAAAVGIVQQPSFALIKKASNWRPVTPIAQPAVAPFTMLLLLLRKKISQAQ